MIPYFLRRVVIAFLSPLQALRIRLLSKSLGDDEVLDVELAAIDFLICFHQLEKPVERDALSFAPLFNGLLTDDVTGLCKRGVARSSASHVCDEFCGVDSMIHWCGFCESPQKVILH